MATVFMKWLEQRPQDYERGIQLLTGGRLKTLQQSLVAQHLRPGMRVLDLGCGTGSLSVQLAEAGAEVVGIDAAPAMLAVAGRRAAASPAADQITLTFLDATRIGEVFEPGSFDLILGSLFFSELPPETAEHVLRKCAALLKPQGQLVVLDETIPEAWAPRRWFLLKRVPLALLTWLLTRTTTHPLRDFHQVLQQAGFAIRHIDGRGSLTTFAAQPAAFDPPVGPQFRSVRHRVTLRTRLLDLWALFFRIIPPYPKHPVGLYAIGSPTRSSPVLVTGNYELTVRRLVRALDGSVDAWLVVGDSAGINVWCASGGGFFTAEKVIAALNSTRVAELVDHHALILPQLAANGVDGWRIRQQTSWGVHWGPIRAADLPQYLSGGRKSTPQMRRMQFPVKDRLEMVSATVGFYGLLILLPVWLFWRPIFWAVAAALLGLSYSFAVFHPWLPGRDGLQKSIPLSLLALLGLLLFRSWTGSPGLPGLFNWSLGMVGLSIFAAAELQGMSPLMRGEQANWGWEALLFSLLGLMYWLIPPVLGWR